MIYENIIETIGGTPIVKLNSVASHIKATVAVKVEYFNPGHSIKDRIALQMIEDAERDGRIKPGGTIIESTSGNTGMGLALAAAVKGYRCIFTMADKQSQEKIDILRAVGAEVIVCPTNVEAEDPRSYYSIAGRLSKEIPNSIWMNQYDNPSNRAAHIATTGPEIWRQTEGKVTHFVAGMGTCGTITGISSYLKEQNPNIQTVGIDTYGSVFKKLKETGKVDTNEIYPYLTEGIGEDIVPENCDMSLIDEIIKVSDKDGALMARKLSKMEGLFVGWSCGSAVFGALEYAAKNLGRDDLMVIILPDHGSRYLGKVYNDQWMQTHDFLDEGTMMTAEEILKFKTDRRKVITLNTSQTLAEAIAVMREQDVSQIPVSDGVSIVGSVNETRVLNTILDDPSLKEGPVTQAMSDPFPFVLRSTRLDIISKLINKDNPAVLVQGDNGSLEIITKFDLIGVLAR
ncbi:pyridoxal-phosphate dependent enzyme [Pontibacter sp. G13]|uniref:pyridoxal-phosphate dependent enzyme n=1 Tax=Pontibacter sp. G13 TaxID=3074898 RepID=UPI00288940F5|nr:pyridoxal-phosphate dependent enzyme [Pontibacter sp. G13]WNJ19725.1 pyridoxal-phosphate dependent enzyme [Pontibacter sp. G13]